MTKVEALTPILNVSDLEASFVWFDKLGWEKAWAYGNPPEFGCVCNGKVEIFLCKDGQGSRGGPMPSFAGDDNTGGVWMSWWVSSPAEVDATHALAVEHGLIVTWPPTDEPWGVRECHIRHPDGHTFRISAGIGED